MQILDSVLLVDNDEASNFLHKSLIQNLGIATEIYETRNGKEAFDYIENSYRSLRRLPSLVLVDIAMPHMNGIELIRELQSSDLLAVSKIPLAVVTSSDSDKDQNAIKSMGDITYITKPLNEAKFFDILQNSVSPYLLSPEKRRYINEMHQVLTHQMAILKEQHKELKINLEEIRKYRQEVTERIKKYKN